MAPPPCPQLSAEDFEREIRLAVARPDRELDVLQKLLAVKDQMIWRAASAPPVPRIHSALISSERAHTPPCGWVPPPLGLCDAAGFTSVSARADGARSQGGLALCVLCR